MLNDELDDGVPCDEGGGTLPLGVNDTILEVGAELGLPRGEQVAGFHDIVDSVNFSCHRDVVFEKGAGWKARPGLGIGGFIGGTYASITPAKGVQLEVAALYSIRSPALKPLYAAVR